MAEAALVHRPSQGARWLARIRAHTADLPGALGPLHVCAVWHAATGGLRALEGGLV